MRKLVRLGHGPSSRLFAGLDGILIAHEDDT